MKGPGGRGGIVLWGVVLALLLASGCRAVRERVEALKPTVEVTGATVRGVTPTNLVIEAQARIDNPNPVGAHVESVTYDLFYKRGEAWAFLGKGEKKDFQIRPKGSTAVDLPLTLDNLSLVQAMGTTLAQGGQLEIKTSGKVTVTVGPASFTIPFEEVRTASVAR
ncbi:hypothetical protein HRbin23_00788 [bacterium HR23]|nr:hypothetical protein HRbin23_00788 [bacterium HR23]